MDWGSPYDIPGGADPSFYGPGGSGQIPVFRAVNGSLRPKTNSLGTPYGKGLDTGRPASLKETPSTGAPSLRPPLAPPGAAIGSLNPRAEAFPRLEETPAIDSSAGFPETGGGLLNTQA